MEEYTLKSAGVVRGKLLFFHALEQSLVQNNQTRSLLFYFQCNLIKEVKIFAVFSLQWQEVNIRGCMYPPGSRARSGCMVSGPLPVWLAAVGSVTCDAGCRLTALAFASVLLNIVKLINTEGTPVIPVIQMSVSEVCYYPIFNCI